MSDHLTFRSEKRKARPLWLQFFSEHWHLLRCTLLWVFGLHFGGKSIPGEQKRPVVFVTGPLLPVFAFSALKRHFRAAGHPVHIAPRPLPGSPMPGRSARLEHYLTSENIRDCYLIAFSTGAIAAFGLNYRGRDRIRKLIAVGGPFRGTLWSWLFFFLPSGWQLRLGSGWLKNMEVSFTSFLQSQCLFTRSDLIHLPAGRARLGRFDDVEIPEMGHFNLLCGGLTMECVRELISAEEERARKDAARHGEESSANTGKKSGGNRLKTSGKSPARAAKTAKKKK